MATQRITEDYSSHTKDELIAEIDARRTEGRTIDGNTGTLKDDLVAALDLDDHAKDKEKPTPEKPPAKPKTPVIADAPANPLVEASNIPTVEEVPLPAHLEFRPPAIKDYAGEYVRSDGSTPELFALAINKDAPDGKTHFLLNSLHFDNVTPEEFRAKYDEKRDKK